MSETIGNNKLVTLTYIIQDELGETIEQNDLPVSYVHGAGSELHPILENNLEGHTAGERVKISVPPEEGFGEYDPNLVFTDELKNVPPEYRKLGAQAQFHNEAGEIKIFTVTSVDDKTVTLDGNHPLAGVTISFIVDIKEVRDATDDEIAQGQFDHFDQDVINPDPSKTH